MSDGSKSYEQGVQDGVKLWGEACGKQANCDSCPIGMLKGANITCQEFAQKFSPKMTSMLKEMRDGDYTYFDEYVTRFPETKDNVEDVSGYICRKYVFEGEVDCPYSDDAERCKACWLEQYEGDIQAE